MTFPEKNNNFQEKKTYKLYYVDVKYSLALLKKSNNLLTNVQGYIIIYYHVLFFLPVHIRMKTFW